MITQGQYGCSPELTKAILWGQFERAIKGEKGEEKGGGDSRGGEATGLVQET